MSGSSKRPRTCSASGRREITDTEPFANLRRLADSVEDRLELVSPFPGTPQRKPWLNQLGSELRRIELDDNVKSKGSGRWPHAFRTRSGWRGRSSR